jgi:uncharacterized membrane protein
VSEVSQFHETRVRSLTKTISWRCCAVMNSFAVLTATTSSRPLTNAIAMNVTGFFVFYLFERIWNQIHWGRIPLKAGDQRDSNQQYESHKSPH